MKNSRITMIFSVVFLVVGFGFYSMHIFLLESQDQKLIDFIKFSYQFLFGLGFLFFVPLLLLKDKMPNQLGFIFLGSSFVKLIILMILVKMELFDLEKNQLLHFFVPYVLSSAIEIFFISRELKRLD